MSDMIFPVAFAGGSLLSGYMGGQWFGVWWAFLGILSGVAIGAHLTKSEEKKVR